MTRTASNAEVVAGEDAAGAAATADGVTGVVGTATGGARAATT